MLNLVDLERRLGKFHYAVEANGVDAKTHHFP